MLDQSISRHAWRASTVVGSATIGLAVWTAVSVWLNAVLIDGVGTFYDLQNSGQERDALRRAALALYTAGHHVGHGLAVLVGFSLGLQKMSVRATLAITAVAGLALAAGQASVVAGLTGSRLDRWGEDLVHPTPSTILGDLVVFVPVLVCFVLYPLLTMLAGLLGARRGDVGWPSRRVQGAALVPWLFAGPLYLTLDMGPPGGDGWAVVGACWLVALGCLLYMLRLLSTPSRETGHWTAGPRPSRYDRESWM